MASILFLRFDPPVSSETQVKGDSIKNSLGVRLWFPKKYQHFFVAASVALLGHPVPDPPHQRMEPEDGFDEHVDRRGEIIAMADMTEFVRDHGL